MRGFPAQAVSDYGETAGIGTTISYLEALEPQIGETPSRRARIYDCSTSAATLAVGAAMPLAKIVVSPASVLVATLSVASLAFLALLGAIVAKAGGAHIVRATVGVPFLDAFAMGLTAGIGAVVGKAI